MEGESIVIAGWPMQFIPAANPLVEEALVEAVEKDVAGTSVRVFTAEHLAALALQTDRAKDKSRLLQFIETGVLDAARPIAEKLAMLDALRERALAIRPARAASEAGALREEPPPSRVQGKQSE